MGKDREIKELIHQIEANYRDYFQLLTKFFPTPTAPINPDVARKLSIFFTKLNNVEDEVIEFRLKKIIEIEHPYFPVIEPEHAIVAIEQKPLYALIQDFLKRRRDLVKFLFSIPLQDWDRTGVHAVEGHVSFFELVQRMAKQDKKNLSFLKQLLTPSVGGN